MKRTTHSIAQAPTTRQPTEYNNEPTRTTKQHTLQEQLTKPVKKRETVKKSKRKNRQRQNKNQRPQNPNPQEESAPHANRLPGTPRPSDGTTLRDTPRPRTLTEPTQTPHEQIQLTRNPAVHGDPPQEKEHPLSPRASPPPHKYQQQTLDTHPHTCIR